MEEFKKTKIVVVCGPTASGKTKLSVALAKKFNGEIISADSMQIYKGMNIATAKPTADEMNGIKHHLIDFLDPSDTFSVAEYLKLARNIIHDIEKRGKLPIIAGGTGLYIDNLVKNVRYDDYEESESDILYRESLYKNAEEYGNRAVYDELLKVDPTAAKKLHENNLKRVIRALEVINKTGKKMSDVQKENISHDSPYEAVYIGIAFKDREVLYNRINNRVDEMIEAGLLKEAEDFYKSDKSKTAAAAIGYKELKPFLLGERSLDECISHLKQETRKYAKRQLTWFKKNSDINWIYVDETYDFDKILEKAENFIKNS